MLWCVTHTHTHMHTPLSYHNHIHINNNTYVDVNKIKLYLFSVFIKMKLVQPHNSAHQLPLLKPPFLLTRTLLIIILSRLFKDRHPGITLFQWKCTGCLFVDRCGLLKMSCIFRPVCAVMLNECTEKKTLQHPGGLLP